MKIPHWYLMDYLTQFEGEKHQLTWDCLKTVKAVKGEKFVEVMEP